jgi:hypothetical protein
MSGRTGVRNEWAGRRPGTPKEFSIACRPLTLDNGKDVILGPVWVWGMGVRAGRQALGHFAAHSIVVEKKYTVNKLCRRDAK